jgi:hypothetical protein
VLPYDFEKEVWFLIRYPGQLERHPALSDEGVDENHTYKPVEYDAVVYHKIYQDLRLNTVRHREHSKYRMAFSDLLFEGTNVFNPVDKIVGLEPLCGPCKEIFNCEDIPGLGEIAPQEVCFSSLDAPGREIVWRAEKDCSLLDYAKDDTHILPPDVRRLKYAKFCYRLKNSRKWGNVTVHSGRCLNYERDGDSAVIEEWLRRREFIKDTLGNFHGGMSAQRV